MKLIVSEEEIKDAVVLWLDGEKGITVDAEALTVCYKDAGDGAAQVTKPIVLEAELSE